MVDVAVRSRDATAQVPGSRRRSRRNAAYWFVAPALAGLVIFNVGPALANAGLITFTWSPLDPRFDFVGPANLRQVFTDDAFWRALRNTVVYTAVVVPASIALGLGVALMLERWARGRTLLRALYFLPTAAMLVATAVVWQLLLDANAGPLNAVLEQLGVGGVRWLLEPDAAFVSVVLFGIWRNTGYMMVLYLAGLAAIPQSVREAADLDACRGWHRLWHITWPLLRPTTLIAAVIGCSTAFALFDQVKIMTDGGPADATSTLSLLIWREGFTYFSFGRAAVVSVVLFILVLACTIAQRRVLDNRAEVAR